MPSRKLGEARPSTCLSRSVKTMSRMGAVVTWLHRKRALRSLLNGGRAIGRCTQVSGLSSVLERIANMKVWEGSHFSRKWQLLETESHCVGML